MVREKLRLMLTFEGDAVSRFLLRLLGKWRGTAPFLDHNPVNADACKPAGALLQNIPQVFLTSIELTVHRRVGL